MIKKNFFKTTLNKFSVKGEEVYRVTSQLSIKIFRTQQQTKLKKVAKSYSREFGHFQEPSQSPRGDSAMQLRLGREIVHCKALCPN